MIVYNMRYRGAIEYEKMVLNILGFHNHVNAICDEGYKESTIGRTIANYKNECKQVIGDFESMESASMRLYQKQLNHFVPIVRTIGEAY